MLSFNASAGRAAEDAGVCPNEVVKVKIAVMKIDRISDEKYCIKFLTRNNRGTSEMPQRGSKMVARCETSGTRECN